MTIILGGTALSLGTAGAVSGAVIGATAGLALGMSVQIVGAAGSAGGIAGAVGASVSAGAILGTALGKGLDCAVAGGATGAASSLLAASRQVIQSGPVGWMVLGAAQEETAAACTFDCWKPVLHDDSLESSNGRLLRDVVIDSRIKQVTTALSATSSLPEIFLENIWNERFRIEYIMLPTNQMAAHAVLL
jgi:hypothetical protein